MERANAWKKYQEEDKRQAVYDFADGYRKFLSEHKTERECAAFFEAEAKQAGFENLDEIIASGKTLKAGDKVYAINKKKMVAAFVIGKRPLSDGMRILGAHIDSPRLDLKQNPLYEDTDMALLDTHYYGGVKKYQWVTLPLALHGVIVKKDGSVINVCIGEKDEEPVFGVSDLLIHLSAEQMEKKANKVIEGENLDVLVGSKPLEGKEKDAVKEGILEILKEKYDMTEEDFMSAEIEVVPAGHAREAGLDHSMVMSYGQDDRVCAYTSLAAMLEVEEVEKTTCCLLTDKEEIGSVGATGMQSRFFENSVAELMDAMGEFSELSLRRCLANSSMLSSDVNAAYDPLFANAFEKNNASLDVVLYSASLPVPEENLEVTMQMQNTLRVFVR